MKRKKMAEILGDMLIGEVEDYPAVQRASVETSIKRIRNADPLKVFRIDKMNDYSFKVTRKEDKIKRTVK